MKIPPPILRSYATAQDVAEALHNLKDGTFFRLETYSETGERGAAVKGPTLNIRQGSPAEKTTLPSTYEIVYCVTDTGHEVGIELGYPGWRFEHAKVHVAHLASAE